MRVDSDKTAIKRTTWASSRPLLRHLTAESFAGHFNYCGVIGNRNNSENEPGLIGHAQLINEQGWSENRRTFHAKALTWIRQYLAGTKDKGLLIKPD